MVLHMLNFIFINIFQKTLLKYIYYIERAMFNILQCKAIFKNLSRWNLRKKELVLSTTEFYLLSTGIANHKDSLRQYVLWSHCTNISKCIYKKVYKFMNIFTTTPHLLWKYLLLNRYVWSIVEMPIAFWNTTDASFYLLLLFLFILLS